MHNLIGFNRRQSKEVTIRAGKTFNVFDGHATSLIQPDTLYFGILLLYSKYISGLLVITCYKQVQQCLYMHL